MADTYLTRTPSSAGNRAVWTWSAWVKINGSNGNEALFTAGGWSAGQDATGIILYNGQFTTYWNSPSTPTYSENLIRDPSAWYHVVLQANTSTLKVYVNGVERSSKSISGNGAINNTTANTIGRYSDNASGFFNGYMTHVHLTDGTAYGPTAFGETNSDGVWIPIFTPSVTYGTNGFFLQFENSSTPGEDDSGNNNDFTVGGGTVRQVTDTPSNNFATANRVASSGGSDIKEGNLILDAGGDVSVNSTQGFYSGKWYVEMKSTITAGHGNTKWVGVLNSDDPVTYPRALTSFPYTGVGINLKTGEVYRNATLITTLTTFANNDICSLEYDADNGLLYVFKNGTTINSGNAINNGNPIDTSLLYNFHFNQDGGATNNGELFLNFGNPSFSVSSGNADENGFGDFEYEPSTGYLALCTKNLATDG